MAAKLLQEPIECQIVAIDLGTNSQLKSTVNVTVVPNEKYLVSNFVNWDSSCTCKLYL